MKSLCILFKLSVVVKFVNPLGVQAYLGPETLMPLASILAAIVGFFLMFGRAISKLVRKKYRKLRGLPDEVPPDTDVEDILEENKDQ